jgi:hypothetical protein
MTDWLQLLLEIRSKGMKNKGIASFTGASERNVRALFAGEVNEPRFSVGEKIKDLHERLCGIRGNQGEGFKLGAVAERK